MKKIFLSVFLLALIYSCTTDANRNCSDTLDLAIPIFTIELVDESGDNLLLNGTFNLEEIRIRTDSSEFLSENFNFFDRIAISAPNVQGDRIYEIILSEMETDTLVLNSSFREEMCRVEFFNVNTATYNGEEQTIITENILTTGIRVVRE